MAVHLHRSNRTEALVEALAALVRRPLATPLARECIVVQGRGMERWLALRLADRLGVWANAEFPFPRRIVERVLEGVLGPASPPAGPFEPDALTWAIAAALPEHLARAEFAVLARYLAADRDGVRLVELAERIARTFDRYLVYRPELIHGWERGAGADWQALLWRALVARHGSGHVARRAAELLGRVHAPAPAALPERISLFGVATLPPLYLQVLVAAARLVDVHLFVLSASGEYWGEIRSRREIIRALQRADLEAAEAESRLHLSEGHPLLASLGRLGRDFQQILEAGSDYVDDPVDRYADPGEGTLLAALQSDMLRLRQRRPGDPASPPLALAAGDRSVAVHACHGPMREVEILHDQLLALFDADPTLQPHEVVVMSPAIDAYAPFIEAAFGPGRDGRPPIPYRIADRGARAGDAVYDALCRILDVLPRRFTASEVMDLLEIDLVRARLEIEPGELEAARRWILEAGVRWGIDEEHRAATAYPPIREHSWRFGLDRLLLGQAMRSDGTTLFGGVLPYDDVDGSEAALLGRLVAFCEQLFGLREALRSPRPLAAWARDLGDLLAAMVDASGAAAEQHLGVRRALAAIAERAVGAGFDRPVAVDVARAALERALAEARQPFGFLGGGVTFCALVPMRSIPFRVVALLGMNDDLFPRAERALGFDLSATERRPGDRALRDDDRYTFLEALLAAREHLVITYVGQSIRDNALVPPSVVVSELLDAIDAAFVAPGGGPARAHVELRHPLQPFSPRYYRADRDPRLFSYDRQGCAGALSLLGPSHAPPALIAAPLPPRGAGEVTVSLGAFERFFEHPVRAFLQDQLGLYLGGDALALDDREPIVLSGLDEWAVGDGLLARAVQGEDLRAALASVRAGGRLPPGRLGSWLYAAIRPQVEGLAAMTARLTGAPPLAPIDVDVALGAIRLSGVLGALWPSGQIRHQFSRLGRKSEIRFWIRHLLLNLLAGPDHPRVTTIVGRDGDAPAACRFGEVRDPLPILAALARLYVQGQEAPLPFLPQASRAYAEAMHDGGPGASDAALQSARKKLGGRNDRGWHDLDDPYLALLYADHDPLAPPRDGAGPHFGEVALAILAPLLRHRALVAGPEAP